MGSPRRFKSMDLTEDLLKSVDNDSLVEGYLDTSLPHELASSSSAMCLSDHEETTLNNIPPSPQPKKRQIMRGALLTSTPRQPLLKSWLHQTLNRDQVWEADALRMKSSMDMADIQKLALPVPDMDQSSEEDDASSVFSTISSISSLSVASSTKRELSAMFDNYERTYRFKFSRFQRQLLQKEVNKMKDKVNDMKERDERLRQKFEEIQKKRHDIDKETQENNHKDGGTVASQSSSCQASNLVGASVPQTAELHGESASAVKSDKLNETKIAVSQDESNVKEPRPIPPPRKKKNKALQRRSLGPCRSHPYTSPSSRDVLHSIVSPTRCALMSLQLNSPLSPQEELRQLQDLQTVGANSSFRVKGRQRAKSVNSPLNVSRTSGVHPNITDSHRPRRPAPPPPPQLASITNITDKTTEESTPSQNVTNFTMFETSNITCMFDSNNDPSESNKCDRTEKTGKSEIKRRRSLRRSLSGNKIHPVIVMPTFAKTITV